MILSGRIQIPAVKERRDDDDDYDEESKVKLGVVVVVVVVVMVVMVVVVEVVTRLEEGTLGIEKESQDDVFLEIGIPWG